MTTLTFLGTGTSQGVPIIGCHCPVCSSKDLKDKRFRSAALVRTGGLNILIDSGPDFRMQMLRENLSHLDAILFTHNHKDHTGGLDDVRSLNYIDKQSIEIFCEPLVLDTLKEEYSYAFAEHKYPGAPEFHVNLIDERPFLVFPSDKSRVLDWIHDVGYCYTLPDGTHVPTDNHIIARARLAGENDDEKAVKVIPIRGMHGQMPVLGFRFGSIAYITDMSRIPESEFAKLKGLKHLTLNTVSYKSHHSHFSLDEALALADRIGAEHTWLTHLSHNFPVYEQFRQDLHRLCQERGIHSDVQPACDGLTIEG